MPSDHHDIIRNGLTFRCDKVEDENPDLSHLGEWYRKNGVPATPYYDTAARILVVDEGVDENEDDIYEAYTLEGNGEKATLVKVDYNPDDHHADRNCYRYIVGMQNSDGQDAQNRWRCMALDAERLRTYGDSWSCVAVRVRLIVDDEDMDEEALWGIESDSGDDYVAFTEIELIEEIEGRLPDLATKHRKLADILDAAAKVSK